MNQNTNNQDIPPESDIQPAPEIDVNELFQPDPVPEVTSLKIRLFGFIYRNDTLVVSVLIAGLLVGLGLIFIGLKPASEETLPQDYVDDYSEMYSEENLQAAEGDMPVEEGDIAVSDDIGAEFGDDAMDEPIDVIVDDPIYPDENEPVIPAPPEDDVVIPNITTYNISYTNKCYNPANLTIKRGEAIIFTNNSNRDMWPASDNHPSHALYPEFDATGTINPGDSYTFTFSKVGVWGYHDHVKPNCSGTITVQ